jgi:hypothetical protein
MVSNLLKEKRFSITKDSHEHLNDQKSILEDKDSKIISPSLCGAVFDSFGRLFCFSSLFSGRVSLPRSYSEYKLYSQKTISFESSNDKDLYSGKGTTNHNIERDSNNLLYSLSKSIGQGIQSHDLVKAGFYTMIHSFNFSELCCIDQELASLFK